MQLEKIELRNFRCFKKQSFDLASKVIVVCGRNGTGKTTLIEAIHYLCYLKSFRSRLPQELALFDTDDFFIKGLVRQENQEEHTIQVGFAHKKKLAKIDQRVISSYKELFSFYQAVTLTIDDLDLIQGAPAGRRNFIDQLILLRQHDYIDTLRRLKQVLQQRNALLQKPFDQSLYMIWTKQLWDISIEIQNQRIAALEGLKEVVGKLLVDFFDKSYTLDIRYEYKHMQPGETFELFIQRKQSMVTYEALSKRSDFGAHLDDFTLQFCKKKLKSFGSRGQQKLLVLLTKVAQIIDLQDKGIYPIFLLDDFMTDFDQDRMQEIIALLLGLKCQLIITAPMREEELIGLFGNEKITLIELKK